MKSICSLGIAGLPNLPWDFHRQNSRNFLFLHQITVSGFTMISSDAQSLQTFESKDQNNRSLFLSRGFFALRLYTASCCLRARIRNHATRLNHQKTIRLRDCTTKTTSKVFMPSAWSHGTRNSSDISRDGVIADHGDFHPLDYGLVGRYPRGPPTLKLQQAPLPLSP